MAGVEGSGSIFVEEKFLRPCFKDGEIPLAILKGVITSP